MQLKNQGKKDKFSFKYFRPDDTMTDSSFPTESSIKEVTAPEYLCITEDIQPKGIKVKFQIKNFLL